MNEATTPNAIPLLKAPIAPEPDATPIPAADSVLLTVVLALVAFGLVMVYSASAFYASQKFGSATYFLGRDLAFIALGLVAFVTAARVDYGAWRRWVYPLLGLSVALLALVLVVGVRINGARRWFHLGGISFQPAELAKLSLVLYLASSLARKAEKVRSFTVGFVPHILVCGLMMALLLMQPDLGTAVILGLATLVVLFVAGAKASYIGIAILIGAPVVYQKIVGTPWRIQRMLAFLDPFQPQFRHSVGYQVAESLISIGSGGVTGLGLGDGKHKLFFLPEAHTDYIMAIVGEELGLFGMCAVTLAFGVLIWRGVRAALRARDAFGCYVACGVTAMFGLQAVVNLGVVLDVLPTKGLPLPLVSFGGSTLIVDLFAMGILYSISRGAPAPPRIVKASRWPRLFRLGRANRRKSGGGPRVVVES